MKPLAVCGALLSVVALSCAQDSRPAAAPETNPSSRSEITPEGAAERLLGDRPTVRRQAQEWINANADRAVPALVRALGEEPVRRFSFDGVRATGAIKDPRVSEALVRLLDHAEFRWKPQATEALADHAYAPAKDRFRLALTHPVWRSRAAGARGLAAIGARELFGVLVLAAEDEEAPVRLEAAKALWSFGNVVGFSALIQDLSLDRRFLDADHGSLARDAAAKALNEICGGTVFTTPQRVLDLAGLREAAASVKRILGDRAHGMQEIVPPHRPDVRDLPYAVEVRSCTYGDVYLRFDAEGRVVVGRDLLLETKATPALVAPLIEVIKGYDYGPRGKKVVGPVTCDFERLGLLVDGVWKSVVVGEGKRPASMDSFEDAVGALWAAVLGPDAASVHALRVRIFRESP